MSKCNTLSYWLCLLIGIFLYLFKNIEAFAVLRCCYCCFRYLPTVHYTSANWRCITLATIHVRTRKTMTSYRLTSYLCRVSKRTTKEISCRCVTSRKLTNQPSAVVSIMHACIQQFLHVLASLGDCCCCCCDCNTCLLLTLFRTEHQWP